ncbi:MAG: response regulator transcription factor [Oleiphilaceae bacterium]|nr:response regulator transcription factor [Oleiphilaceae bacterium]
MNKVILLDDHQLVRAGLRGLVDSLCDFKVVAEASNGASILELIAEHSADIVITDLAMAGVSGFAVLQQLQQRSPHIPVIVLSMYASKGIVIRALNAGARAYLVKDSAEEELEAALRAVSRGEQYLSPKISGLILSAMREATDSGPRKQSTLTSRQLEVLRLIALGKATKEIAFDLDLSSKTVETHRAQIMERLDIHDVAGLVRYSIKEGLISLDDEV